MSRTKSKNRKNINKRVKRTKSKKTIRRQRGGVRRKSNLSILKRKRCISRKKRRRKHRVKKINRVQVGGNVFSVTYLNSNITFSQEQKYDDPYSESTKFQNEPQIELPNEALNGNWVLVMYDPDTLYGMEDSDRRVYVHWVRKYSNNIGNNSIKYTGPSPPGGIHRYIFVLVSQSEQIETILKPINENTRRITIEKDSQSFEQNMKSGYKIMFKVESQKTN